MEGFRVQSTGSGEEVNGTKERFGRNRQSSESRGDMTF